MVRLSTSICADRQLWRVRAEWLFLVSRAPSAARVILILSSDINKGASLHKVRHTDTLFWQCVKSSRQCQAVKQTLMNEGRAGLCIHVPGPAAVCLCKESEDEEWGEELRRERRRLGVFVQLAFTPAPVTLCAAATVKVLHGVKWLMIPDPSDCHAIRFPTWLCSLPHLFPWRHSCYSATGWTQTSEAFIVSMHV